MIRSIPTEVTNHSKTRTDGVSSSDMLGSIKPFLNQSIGLGGGLLQRGDSVCHLEATPLVGIGDPVGIVPDRVNSAEVPEPDTNVGLSIADVVVGAGNSGEGEWEVVCNDEDDIAFLHGVREVPVVMLARG